MENNEVFQKLFSMIESIGNQVKQINDRLNFNSNDANQLLTSIREDINYLKQDGERLKQVSIITENKVENITKRVDNVEQITDNIQQQVQKIEKDTIDSQKEIDELKTKLELQIKAYTERVDMLNSHIQRTIEKKIAELYSMIEPKFQQILTTLSSKSALSKEDILTIKKDLLSIQQVFQGEGNTRTSNTK